MDQECKLLTITSQKSHNLPFVKLVCFDSSHSGVEANFDAASTVDLETADHAAL